MSSDFKKLNLDQNLLRESIQSYWESNECTQCQYLDSSPRRHKAIYIEDDCEVKMEFIFINDGTTTIHTKMGKNPEIGERLATYLKEQLVSDSRKSVNFAVKNIDEEIFVDLLSFLDELNTEASELASVSLTTLAEDATQKAVKASTRYKDSLTLTHYRTRNKLLIQGKPLYAYAQVSYFLSEYTDLDGFLDIVYKGEANSDRINVDKSTVEADLKALLPTAYNELGEGILKLILTSYTLKAASLELPDYSCYVFPVLRALEGVMKRLMLKKGVELRRDFGEVFEYTRYGRTPHVVRTEYKLRFNDSGLCDALELCYNHYNRQRHSLFHMENSTDDSRFISTQERAVGNIDEVVAIIENAYRKIV